MRLLLPLHLLRGSDCKTPRSSNRTADPSNNRCGKDNPHTCTYRSHGNVQHKHMITRSRPIKYNAMSSFADTHTVLQHEHVTLADNHAGLLPTSHAS